MRDFTYTPEVWLLQPAMFDPQVADTAGSFAADADAGETTVVQIAAGDPYVFRGVG